MPSCCLFEVFTIEEFDYLESGIRRLFPRMEPDSPFGRFRGSADELLAGGWARIGTLVESGGQLWSSSLPVEEIDLPEYVKSVEVWGHRLLPSLFSVSLRAVLKKAATETLIRVQSSHYLPEVRFWPMIPTGPRYRSADNLPDAVALRMLTAHLQQVRSEIEHCFAPFLPGHFMTRPGRTPRLPAVEIYQLKGTGTGIESLRRWKASTRPWWTSMAFEFHPWFSFQNGHILFTLNGSFRMEEDVPYKLLILQDELPEDARFVTTDDFLTSALPGLAIREFIDSIAVDVGKARRGVYRALSRPKILHGLRADIGLSRQLSRETMALERVDIELQNGKRSFHDLKLAGLVNDPEGHGEQRTLYDTLMDALDFQMKTAQSHVKVMAKSFSEHLLVRNMALMYGLQWAILVLSIISIIMAAAGVVSNWDRIERLWHKSERHEAPQHPSTKTTARRALLSDRAR
jgi:hypothetical protein